jgi:hypothetical protein
VRSSVSGGASFILKLDAAGAFQWVNAQSGIYPTAIGFGPGGSLLVAGTINDGNYPSSVVAWRADRSNAWTVGLGVYYGSTTHLAVTPTGFFVSGPTFQDTDLDPGTGSDVVLSGSIFVAEYAF